MITWIFGYANALCENLDSGLWDGLYQSNLKNKSVHITGEKEQHALISPVKREYGSKDPRNSNCPRVTWTLPHGSVLLGQLVKKP